MKQARSNTSQTSNELSRRIFVEVMLAEEETKSETNASFLSRM
nr:hypothetical protein [Evansella caseinilytica]